MAQSIRRKLIALDFPNHGAFNFEDFNINLDDSEFRNLIVWLEDRKIRNYTIEQRTPLRDVENSNWKASFYQFLSDVGYPYVDDIDENSCASPGPLRLRLLDWILGQAVRLEFEEAPEKYQQVNLEKAAAQKQQAHSNPFENIDFDNPEVSAAVEALAMELRVPPHPASRELMCAVSSLVAERLGTPAPPSPTSPTVPGAAAAAAGADTTVPKTAASAAAGGAQSAAQPSDRLPIELLDSGLDTKDPAIIDAVRVLRLLHIGELRTLQDGADEYAVTVYCEATKAYCESED